ncbi:acylphosphatase [Heyndrickxia sporothermodurans]|uniref:acylphosphatase n=1 Tax=Heyndrickxia sporothermodurans TaxID=46224 RepID=UPI002E245A21|nr:acylphosphatase [Heyndrickxia sporothermodurans]
MSADYPNWLTKEMVAGIRKYNLDAYLVALEGWRRGLTLKWYYDMPVEANIKLTGKNTIGKIFSLSNDDHEFFFYRSRGAKVSNEAVDIINNKEDLKSVLFNAKISFLENEKYKKGESLRIYVVGNSILGALKRTSANVIGNGKQSIEKLIINRNHDRQTNPYLSTRPITIDHELFNVLASQNYTIQSVPRKDEVVYLKENMDVSKGADTIDVTNSLSTDIRELAINAVMAIPGLYHAGVDITVENGKAYVVDIDPTAAISAHVFPTKGQPRNIAEGIIDAYFPETIGLASDRTKIYFDYKKIREMLLSKSVKKIEVTDAPKGPIYAKRYVISGEVQLVGYRKWIQKQALKHELNGYTKNLRNGKVVVVVGSGNKEAVDNFKQVCYQGSKRSRVDDIQEYIWDKRVKIGFEVKEMN